ncbi:MAG TPA: hypothetical protein DEH78_12630 [Solibacterales bacterium]|nr:hypothetical protein [Bryobacterales bacterium]
MRWFLGVLAAAAAVAQTPAPGLLRGELLDREGEARAGLLVIRADDSKVYRCAYDARTLFERSRLLIGSATIKFGERIEAVADSADSACYLRTVHVAEAPPARRLPPRRPVTTSGSSVLDNLFPRGNLTYAGVILKLNPERLVLRTRDAREHTIFLRPDTRYLEQGTSAGFPALRVNTRVFVRAGRNFENVLEAFQVVWGDILPRP